MTSECGPLQRLVVFAALLRIDGDLKFDRMVVPGIPADTYFYDVHADDGDIRVDHDFQWDCSVSMGSGGASPARAMGSSSPDLVALAIGHGELWIAYRDAFGLARLRFRGEHVEIKNVIQRDGLSSDLMYGVAFDRGRL